MLPSVLPEANGSYLAAALLATALFFASILAHELAHALVARHYGQRVEDITLWALGGMARMGSEAPSPRAEASVALVGPGTSLGLGGLFLAAGLLLGAGADSLLSVVLVWLGVINLALAIFNALPGAPLDGGRVVAAAVWKRTGDRRRGQIAAARAGRFVGGALIALGLTNLLFGIGFGTLWTAVIGWFILQVAQAEEAAARATRALEGRRLRDVMTPAPPEAPEWTTAGEVRRTMPLPPPHQRRIVLRGYDGMVRSTVYVDAVRHAPDGAVLRDFAQPAHVGAADDAVLDAVDGLHPFASVVVMDGAQVAGIVGREELAAVPGVRPRSTPADSTPTGKVDTSAR
jgi:Zn-dependent protease